MGDIPPYCWFHALACGSTVAAEAGFYEFTVWGRRYPKVQLLTVAGLLEGETIDMPPVRQVGQTFKKAPKATGQGPEQDELPS